MNTILHFILYGLPGIFLVLIGLYIFESNPKKPSSKLYGSTARKAYMGIMWALSGIFLLYAIFGGHHQIKYSVAPASKGGFAFY